MHTRAPSGNVDGRECAHQRLATSKNVVNGLCGVAEHLDDARQRRVRRLYGQENGVLKWLNN